MVGLLRFCYNYGDLFIYVERFDGALIYIYMWADDDLFPFFLFFVPFGLFCARVVVSFPAFDSFLLWEGRKKSEICCLVGGVNT